MTTRLHRVQSLLQSHCEGCHCTCQDAGTQGDGRNVHELRHCLKERKVLGMLLVPPALNVALLILHALMHLP